jgi:peroxiredoxin
MKEDPAKVKIMVESLGVTLQVLMDKYGKVAEKYGVKSLPRLLVIDQKSKVHYIHDGYAPGDENKLKEVLDKLADAKK